MKLKEALQLLAVLRSETATKEEQERAAMRLEELLRLVLC